MYKISAVAAARKVCPHWLQEIITQHCLSLYPVFYGKVSKPMVSRVRQAAHTKICIVCEAVWVDIILEVHLNYMYLHYIFLSFFF